MFLPKDVKVVVGSGYNDYYGESEIYSKNDNSFQYGPNLPYAIEGPATVQYGDSIILVGGLRYDCYCDNSGKLLISIKMFADYTYQSTTFRNSLLEHSGFRWLELGCYGCFSEHTQEPPCGFPT